MAKSRDVVLKQRVLTKLMLLERFRPESFRSLADAQAKQNGKPKELAAAEKMLIKPAHSPTDSGEEAEGPQAGQVLSHPQFGETDSDSSTTAAKASADWCQFCRA